MAQSREAKKQKGGVSEGKNKPLCLSVTETDVGLPCLSVFPGKTRKVEGRCMTIELIPVSYQEVQR